MPSALFWMAVGSVITVLVPAIYNFVKSLTDDWSL